MSKRPSTTEGTRSLSIHLASATWEVEAVKQLLASGVSRAGGEESEEDLDEGIYEVDGQVFYWDGGHLWMANGGR